MKIAPFLTALCLATLAAWSAPLTVDNRPAQADEWGYRPADGSTAVMNPPSLTWIHDKHASTYDVQWTRDAVFTDAPSVANVPWCVYTHNAPLAERAAVFVKPDIIVLYDDFAAPRLATFQFMLHGLSAFTLDEAAQTLRLDQKDAGLTVKYLASQPLAFTQTDGFKPAPKMRGTASPFPNQWHVEAAMRQKTLASDTLTVLVPYRSGAYQAWTAERVDTATASGLRLTRDGKTIGIAFRKHAATAAEWDGKPFDGPVVVTGL